jgi:hypothetical protein
MRLLKLVLFGLLLSAFATIALAQKADEKAFKAWVNLQPGPHMNTLYVTGDVIEPTSGWKVELVEASPQGINPTILILDVKATAPTGQVLQVVTPVPVRFEKPDGKQYKKVTIHGAGPDFTVDVTEAN